MHLETKKEQSNILVILKVQGQPGKLVRPYFRTKVKLYNKRGRGRSLTGERSLLPSLTAWV